MTPTETQLQIAVADLLKWAAVPGLIFFHPANGEFRNIATAKRLKAMGVRPGVADWVLVLPNGVAAFLELKTATGRPSSAQAEFCASCMRINTPYRIAYSFEQAKAILLELGAIKCAPNNRPVSTVTEGQRVES